MPGTRSCNAVVRTACYRGAIGSLYSFRLSCIHSDSYLREMDATVVAVEGQGVALDQTAFYAQGGGQPADRGILRWDGGEAPVLDVRKTGDTVLHTVDGTPPPVGSRVRGSIDWE